MNHPKLVSLLVMLLVFSSVAGVCWALNITHEPDEQKDNSMPQLMIHEQILDAAIAYIGTNHAETAQFLGNLAWTGGRVTPENLLGSEKYTYQSSGWIVTINYPVVTTPVYKITVNYVSSEAGSISIPYAIAWKGSWTNEGIIETEYTFAQ